MRLDGQGAEDFTDRGLIAANFQAAATYGIDLSVEFQAASRSQHGGHGRRQQSSLQ